MRASELKIQTELPERGDQERETSSFWFRRVTTALLLGNGGGIVTLSSYLANASDKPGVAILAYPALTNFFSGALLGFSSYAISLLIASLRFDSHMNIFSRAAEMARKAGKTASTQHDGIFVFLILLAGVQTCFLVGAGVSFYNGSSYILSVLGREACKDSRERYCYGSPIIFPFVNPMPDLSAAENTSPAPAPTKPSDFTAIAAFGSDRTPSRIYVSPPYNRTIAEITSETTVQMISPKGELCLFSTPFFADGGLALVEPNEITQLKNRLEQKGYSFIPVSSRILISSFVEKDKNELTILNIGFSDKNIFPTGEHIQSRLSIHPFAYGDIKGIVLLRYDADYEKYSDCLNMAEDAGFIVGQREKKISIVEDAQ